ncbi:uncharacterized protein KQ657_000828 [Scheffersomyces spartinae]|uniref:Amino acid transporter transmembrane domain-containing protein n=1 Tax=Scheffersomyces spartinae TaxID=45513 RepID=A0A9P8AI65_9ASCO|nr:uncharacterized protein KQ657_000828 [Scheffersomyces spartinae]KAG7193410.1 hypothetical protein KQ657_000828 [Scheffersomyces spartinae]
MERKADVVSSSVSLIKTIIGAGMLSMPLAYSTDGLIVGTLIILLAAATSGFGLFIQAYVSRYVPVGHATFFNVCSISYPSLNVLFDIAIAIQCFGCAISYLVLVGDLMPTIIPHLPFVTDEHLRTFFVALTSVVLVPLLFLKNLDSLKYTSILGLFAIFYMVLLVIINYLLGVVPIEQRGEVELFPPNFSGVFSTFSIIVFAFTGHQNMFSIINEAKDNSLPSLTVLINGAVIISSGIFIVFGLCGYLTFGDNVSGNVILHYAPGLSTTFGRFCIVFMVLFSFPLMLHPARISVNNVYHWFKHCNDKKSSLSSVTEETRLLNDEQILSETESQLEVGLELALVQSKIPGHEACIVPLPQKRFVIITIGLLVAGYALALSLLSFALVLAVVGATGSTAISFILPGLFGYKLIGAETSQPTHGQRLLQSLSFLLVIWGFAVMFVCLYVILVMDKY